MAEIIKRYMGKALWESKDVEGRKVYALAKSQGGIYREPTIWIHRTIKAAMSDK